MIATTLPISYTEGRSIRILSSSIVSSLLSKMVNAKVCFPLNNISVRGSSLNSITERVGAFRTCLNALEILSDSAVIIEDNSGEVLKNSQELMFVALQSGLCFSEVTTIAHCDCGKVEIPANILSKLRCDTHQSMFLKVNDSLVCRVCGNVLKYSSKEGLFYNQPNMTTPMVLPSNYKGRFSAISREIAGRKFYVSRLFRSMSECVNLGDYGCLDPDFHSALYLVYLRKLHNKDLMLVVGINHFYRACRAYLIAKSFDPELNITIIAHPMFYSEGNLMKQSVKDAVNSIGSARATKLLFATMLQWTRPDSYCTLKEIERIVSFPFCEINFDSVQLEMPFDNTLLMKVNRNAYMSLLSKIRKGNPLTEQDRILYHSIS